MHISSHLWLMNVVQYLKLEIIAFGCRIAKCTWVGTFCLRCASEFYTIFHPGILYTTYSPGVSACDHTFLQTFTMDRFTTPTSKSTIGSLFNPTAASFNTTNCRTAFKRRSEMSFEQLEFPSISIFSVCYIAPFDSYFFSTFWFTVSWTDSRVTVGAVLCPPGAEESEIDSPRIGTNFMLKLNHTFNFATCQTNTTMGMMRSYAWWNF